jgi:YVTN family beta-propeller protein
VFFVPGRRVEVGVARRAQRRHILFLAFGALVSIGIVLVYVTLPSPTILTVRVLDRQTDLPLAGAQVQVRLPGREPLPTVTTGGDGLARFERLTAGSNYEIRVQRIDYERAEDQLEVAEDQETAATMPLELHTGERLFVGLNRASVVQIDTASLLVVRTVDLPAPPDAPVRHLLMHPDGDLLYAVAGSEGYIISSHTGAVLAELEVEGRIDSLELSAEGDRVLLAGLSRSDLPGLVGQRRLWTLDAQSGASITETLLSASAPDEEVGIVWRSEGNDLDTLRATSRVIEALDAGGRRHRALGRVPVGASSRDRKIVLSAGAEYLYYGSSWYSNDTGTFTDVVLMTYVDDGATVYQEVPLGLSALAASPLGLELYVLNARLGTLTILDLTGAKPPTLVPVGRQPEALIVSPDGWRIYVADREGQAIYVVDVASAEVVAVIQLGAEPLSMAAK